MYKGVCNCCVVFLCIISSIKAYNKPDGSFFYDTIAPTTLLFHLPSLFQAHTPNESSQLSPNELDMLQEGDFILRRGYGWISNQIVDVLDEQYPITHCGLILRDNYNEPMVLHSLSNEEVDGIIIQSLSSFLKESQPSSLIGVRLRLDKKAKQVVVREAKRLKQKGVPFDINFDNRDSTRFYCSELFAYILKNVTQQDFLPEKLNFYGKKLIRMCNFYHPKRFIVLFNQFEKKG